MVYNRYISKEGGTMKTRMRMVGGLMIFAGVLLVFVVFFNTTVSTPERYFFDGFMSKQDLGIVTLIGSAFLLLQGFALRWIGSAKEQS